MNIAVDLGGTNIRVATVERQEIINIISEPCKANGKEEEVLEHIACLISSLMTPDIGGIGIGVPSVVDVEAGIVYNVAGIPSWREVHLKKYLENIFHLPVYINNDCNCFAKGVAKYGEGKDYSDIVCITLGTGVGSGLIIRGELYSGNNTGAGEIGSLPYLDKDYEYYCSSRFFIDRKTTGKQAFDDAEKGDLAALDLWREFGWHLGQLLKTIIYIYDPQAVVFGGSIAKAFRFYKSYMLERLNDFPYKKSVERLKIHFVSLENMGIIGAASLCK